MGIYANGIGIGIGRCSHVCNAGFFTTPAARNRGVGRVMGEVYLEVAPKLVCFPLFNLFLRWLGDGWLGGANSG